MTIQWQYNGLNYHIPFLVGIVEEEANHLIGAEANEFISAISIINI